MILYIITPVALLILSIFLMIKCSKKRFFKAYLLITIVLLLVSIIFLIKEVSKSVLVDKPVYSEFVIVDEGDVACDPVPELIYKDKDYEYYIRCISSNYIMIVFSNNEKKPLKDALNNGDIPIEQIMIKYPDLIVKIKNGQDIMKEMYKLK